MNKKPAAALSANLVAVKGAAAPAPDMAARSAPAWPLSTAAEPHVVVSPAAKKEEDGALSPLNFRVPADFRREFKTYAAQHDLKLNELLRRSFQAYRRMQRD